MRFPSVTRFVQAISAFFRRPVVVPDDVLAQRQARCHACPQYDSRIDQCNRCTCFVAFKTLLATEKCPDRHWGEYFNLTNNGLN